MNTTAQVLKQIRQHRKYSKYAVEHATHIDHSNVFLYEHGERFPTANVISTLARFYDMTDNERQQLLDAIKHDLVSPYRDAL